MKKSLVDNLLAEALAHRAVCHPYLTALEEGSVNHVQDALKDFAAQYLGYTSWFPKYLTAAISKLDNPTHREPLIENLAEENGILEEEELEVLKEMGIKAEWVQGIPHPELFRRFQKAMNVDGSEVLYCDEVIIWREIFLNTILQGSCEEAIGLLGLGTEAIVKHIYKKLIAAVKNHTTLSMEEYVFFELHTEVDDKHGDLLLNIAREMCETEEGYKKVRMGMLKALSLRCMYWDAMYNRAKQGVLYDKINGNNADYKRNIQQFGYQMGQNSANIAL